MFTSVHAVWWLHLFMLFDDCICSCRLMAVVQDWSVLWVAKHWASIWIFCTASMSLWLTTAIVTLFGKADIYLSSVRLRSCREDWVLINLNLLKKLRDGICYHGSCAHSVQNRSCALHPLYSGRHGCAEWSSSHLTQRQREWLYLALAAALANGKPQLVGIATGQMK